MGNENKNYVESLNHNPNWLKTINIEIDKFLIIHEYIEFFIQMYMQWSKYNGYTSSLRKIIIPRLPSFETLDLSQFKLYIQNETMAQCFLCFNFQNTILIWSAEGTETFFCILHMLRIHTGLQKLIKINVYDLQQKKEYIWYR